MTPRQKNMLEAFQASSEESLSQSEAETPSGAPAATAVRHKSRGGLPDVAPELFAIVLCVLVVGAFFLGRWSMDATVEASEPDTAGPIEEHTFLEPASPVDEEAPAQAEAERADSPQATSASTERAPGSMSALEMNHEAFMDPANDFTVRIVYYDDDKTGQTLAFKTATYLSGLGFPAMIPVRKGGYVFICVGAGRTKNDPELLRIQRELRLVPGPPPSSRSGDFESAYIYNIDKLIQR